MCVWGHSLCSCLCSCVSNSYSRVMRIQAKKKKKITTTTTIGKLLPSQARECVFLVSIITLHFNSLFFLSNSVKSVRSFRIQLHMVCHPSIHPSILFVMFLFFGALNALVCVFVVCIVIVIVFVASFFFSPISPDLIRLNVLLFFTLLPHSQYHYVFC